MKYGFYSVACLAAVSNAVLLKESSKDDLPKMLNLASADTATGAGLSEELERLNKQFAEIEGNIAAANKLNQDAPTSPAGYMNGDYKFVMGQVTVDGLGEWGSMSG